MAGPPILPRSDTDPAGLDRLVQSATAQYMAELGQVYKDALAWLKGLPRVAHGRLEVNARRRYDYLVDAQALASAVAEIQTKASGVPTAPVVSAAKKAYASGTAKSAKNLIRLSSDYTRTVAQALGRDHYQKRQALLEARVFEEMAGFQGEAGKRLGRALRGAVEEGKTIHEATKAIQEEFAASKSRAKRIARTEIIGASRRARLDEAEDAEERLGIKTKMMHLSALSATTRKTHAKRHKKLYTRQQVRDWYSKDGNAIHCKCTQVEVLIDDDGEPLFAPEITDDEKKRIKDIEAGVKKPATRQQPRPTQAPKPEPQPKPKPKQEPKPKPKPKPEPKQEPLADRIKRLRTDAPPPGTDDAAQVKALEEIFSGRLKNVSPEDFVSAFLGGFGAEIGGKLAQSTYLSTAFGHRAAPSKDKVFISASAELPTPGGGYDLVQIDRNLDFSTGTATHSLLTIPKFVQAGKGGKSIGKQVLMDSVALYDKIGIRHVGLIANIGVGGYAWAKYGFVPEDYALEYLHDEILEKGEKIPGWGAIKKRVGPIIDALKTDPKAIWAISDLTEEVAAPGGGKIALGKQLLLGTEWIGKIDLTDKDQRRRFDAYIGK